MKRYCEDCSIKLTPDNRDNFGKRGSPFCKECGEIRVKILNAVRAGDISISDFQVYQRVGKFRRVMAEKVLLPMIGEQLTAQGEE